MLQFQYPHLLWLLLAVPALAALYLYGRYSRRRRLRRFGHERVLACLMPDASRYMPGVKTALELAILALLIVILARPVATSQGGGSLGGDATETSLSGLEIMLCIDVSNSMLASSTDDPDGISRMARTRLIVEKLIDKLSDDKVGLVVFAGDAYLQLPITTDFISAKMFMSSLDPGMVSAQGTAIGQAIDLSVAALDNGSDFSKAIIVITDGENFEDDAAAAAARAAKAGIRVDVIGVGTEKGAPIPLPGHSGQYLTWDDGQRVITSLNVEEARKIAKAGDGVYIAGSSPSAVKQLEENLSDLATRSYTRVTHSPAAEQFPVLAWIALALLLVDTFVVTRKISWLRHINFFTKPKTPKK